MPSAFLDAASGQPLNPAAREALGVAVDAGWADPARLYREGRQAALLLEAARESIAARIGARPAEVMFTASGPQALHLGIAGTLAAQPSGARAPFVVSAVEHSGALAEGDVYAEAGGEVRVVGVDRLARVDVESFTRALPGSALACLQAANHEVGTRQPLADVAGACTEVGVPLLVDAAMVLGREDPPQGWSLLAGSARSWGGPPGVGVLCVRGAVRWRAPGARDERGPEIANVPLAVAAARGLEWADEHRRSDAMRARRLTDEIRSGVADVPDVVLLGDPVDRLDYLTAFSCLYVDGEALVLGLDREGYAVSSGSSCVADTRRPSHVLAAMGVLTQGNVRVSLPFGTTEETVRGFLATLPGVVREVRAFLGAPEVEDP